MQRLSEFLAKKPKNSFEPLDSDVKEDKEDSTDLLFSSLALIYRDPARNNQQAGKERPQVNIDRYKTTHFLSMKPERGGGYLCHSPELGV
jgi:hypothetical protein